MHLTFLTFTVTCLYKEIESVLDAKVAEDDPLDGVHAEVGAGVVVGVIEVRLDGEVLSQTVLNCLISS